MTVLCVNRFLGGEHVPTGRMLQDVVTELSVMGINVRVVSSHAEYSSTDSAGSIEGSSGVSIVRVWSTGVRLVDWILFWWVAMAYVVFGKWDRCLVLTDPPFLSVASLLCRRPIISWVMDLYPEALVANGIVRDSSFAHRFLQRLNLASLSKCAQVICLDEAQRLRISGPSTPGGFRTPAVIVGPWDRRLIKRFQGDDNRFIQRTGLQGKQILLYAGNLGAAHHFEAIINAAALCQRLARDDWRFVFVVRGRRVNELADAVRSRSLENVVIRDYESKELTSEMLSSASVHVITLRPGWEGIVVPSKLYGLLGLGRPVVFLGPRDSGTAVEIERLGIGRSLSADVSAQDLLDVLDSLEGNQVVVNSSLSFQRALQVAKLIVASGN